MRLRHIPNLKNKNNEDILSKEEEKTPEDKKQIDDLKSEIELLRKELELKEKSQINKINMLYCSIIFLTKE